MISQSSKYYGAVFSYLLDEIEDSIKIQRVCLDRSGFYVVNEMIPIYVKYDTSRKGPWTFTFRQDHQERYISLVKKFGQGVVAFVCGGDGIVALEYEELQTVLNHNVEQQKSVSIRRKLNQMYGIKGSDGELDRKISRKSLIEILQPKIISGNIK